jgi:lysozyme
MTTSDTGLHFIAGHEGLRLQSYQDSVGVWTIGYGHTSKVKQGQTITEAEALAFLREDLAIAEKAVNTTITAKLSQNQFDALVSLAFNIGAGAFSSSTLARRFNQGRILEAADAFLVWCHGGGMTLPGLLKRRKDERALFLGGV